MTAKQRGVARLYFATIYSIRGLTAAFRSEAAIRQELAAMAILVPVAMMADVTTTERLLLIICLFIVLITELLNSAIEALSDRVSTEIHVLIAKAKNIASAAVFVALILAAICWFTILVYP
ncbi:diacylglycerol kinase [Alteromonas pelagimontana]|uniref:Diacylglycerol kinase n=1 Tax=Alteromonas pelagimontana TaxID=1858656 RepID=A0A6M4MKP2_9ALTE|nr:diacylglycerol kinase [Alteromonas pelagimontana]QJR82646.1 diacylglycerol kinase [Alteromonas pelagimontana]